jgi:hypothetical protein
MNARIASKVGVTPRYMPGLLMIADASIRAGPTT